jgi:uncharacterized protein with von Willebrand factor type A (vWA) domain
MTTVHTCASGRWDKRKVGKSDKKMNIGRRKTCVAAKKLDRMGRQGSDPNNNNDLAGLLRGLSQARVTVESL